MLSQPKKHSKDAKDEKNPAHFSNNSTKANAKKLSEGNSR